MKISCSFGFCLCLNFLLLVLMPSCSFMPDRGEQTHRRRNQVQVGSSGDTEKATPACPGDGASVLDTHGGHGACRGHTSQGPAAPRHRAPLVQASVLQ